MCTGEWSSQGPQAILPPVTPLQSIRTIEHSNRYSHIREGNLAVPLNKTSSYHLNPNLLIFWNITTPNHPDTHTRSFQTGLKIATWSIMDCSCVGDAAVWWCYLLGHLITLVIRWPYSWILTMVWHCLWVMLFVGMQLHVVYITCGLYYLAQP